MDTECGCADLTLMATGTLFSVKIFRRNAEHVVTLDAHAMKNRLSRHRSFVFRSVSLSWIRLSRHEQILAQHDNSKRNTVPTGVARTRDGRIAASRPRLKQRILTAAVGDPTIISAGRSFAA